MGGGPSAGRKGSTLFHSTASLLIPLGLVGLGLFLGHVLTRDPLGRGSRS
jgi:hypothetical protein